MKEICRDVFCVFLVFGREFGGGMSTRVNNNKGESFGFGAAVYFSVDSGIRCSSTWTWAISKQRMRAWNNYF
jgi:hypothetical protein